MAISFSSIIRMVRAGVVDGVEQNGALLQAASNVPAGVAALSLLPFLFFRRRNA